MITKIIYLTVILLLFGLPLVQAQDAPAQQAKPGSQVQSLILPVAGDPSDPKLTPGQRELMLRAGEDNPSRPAPAVVDPRLTEKEIPDEKYYGESNSKPPVTSDADLRKEIEAREALMKQSSQPVVTATPVSPGNNDQPIAKPAEGVINYRNFKGPDDQPKPTVKGNVTNYREIIGPNEQPLGTQPKK